VSDHFLLLGGHRQSEQDRHSWFIPIFSYHNYGSLADMPEKNTDYRLSGRKFWCLPFCWYANQCQLRPSRHPVVKTNHSELSTVAESQPVESEEKPKPRPVREYTFKHGAFPLWSYSDTRTPDTGSSTVKGAVLGLVYDYKHELGPDPTTKSGATNDYTRARVCWRLWHYERLNGNTSLDVFPTFTYDSKTNGFTKSSFLWRFFRYERSPGSTPALDVLFIPLSRPKTAASPSERAVKSRP
jgi:hypothetical protein